MPKAMDLITTEPPKILLWGPPGTWKTAFAMTAGEKAELIDIDGNLPLGLKDSLHSHRMSIDVTQFKETDPNQATVYMKVKERIMQVYRECSRKTYTKRLLILDSLTSLSEHVMRMTMAGSGKLNIVATPKDPSMTEPMWGIAITEINNICMLLRDLPVACLLIGHANVRDINGVQQEVVSCFGKRSHQTIPLHFSELLYTRVILDQNGKPKGVINTVPLPGRTVRSSRGISNDWEMSKGILKLFEEMGYPL